VCLRTVAPVVSSSRRVRSAKPSIPNAVNISCECDRRTLDRQGPPRVPEPGDEQQRATPATGPRWGTSIITAPQASPANGDGQRTNSKPHPAASALVKNRQHADRSQTGFTKPWFPGHIPRAGHSQEAGEPRGYLLGKGPHPHRKRDLAAQPALSLSSASLTFKCQLCQRRFTLWRLAIEPNSSPVLPGGPGCADMIVRTPIRALQ
jgi:hypothetical protein